MKFLIVLLAFVAFSKADESFKVCINETLEFKKCIVDDVIRVAKENGEQLHALKPAIEECFKEASVKDICKLPPMMLGGPPPPPPAAVQQHARPAFPPPDAAQLAKFAKFGQCFGNASKAFFTCFKKECGIPDDAQPHEMPEHAGPGGPPGIGGPGGPGFGGPGGPPGFGGPGGFSGPQDHFFDHERNPEEIKKLVTDKICGGNAEAADNLIKCAWGALKPALPAIIKVKLAACDAVPTCFKSKPISKDCLTKLITGAKAFCTCRSQAEKFFNEDECCSDVRDAKAVAEAHRQAASAAENQVAAFHDHLPGQQVDFCSIDVKAVAQKHEEGCKKLREALAKVQAPPPSA